MLDTTLFSVSIPSSPIQNKSLILSGCRMTFPEGQEYSEFDELAYYALNNNDYEYGRVDIEISCENNLRDPYSRFYISCIAIRADSKVLCKINQNSTPQILLLPNYTKVTSNGKMAFGISYYFRSELERTLLLNCKSFCIEGFVAFKKKDNGYGFMCRVERPNEQWVMREGNTYRIYRSVNIEHLQH